MGVHIFRTRSTICLLVYTMINEDHSGPGFQKNKNLPKVSKVFRKKIFGKHPMFKKPVSKKGHSWCTFFVVKMSTLLKFLSSMCIIFVSDTFWAEWTYFSLKLLGCVEKSSLFIVQRFSTYLHTNDVVEINLLYIHGKDVLISSFYVETVQILKNYIGIWLFSLQ